MAGVDADTHRMEGKLRPPGPPDREIAELAEKQHGVVALGQLLELGLSARSVSSRLARGRLHRLHQGVYAVGHRVISHRGRALAAVQAGGDGALLSHRSAAALWDLRIWPEVPEITVPGHGWRHQPGLRVHSSRTLEPEDAAVRDGIPVTTVERAILDLAELVDFRTLHRAFEEAERLRLVDMQALGRIYERNRGRHGLRPLRQLIAGSRLPEPAARSELERRFLDLCHEAGLPRPASNALAAGFEVDALWPAERLVVELDGHQFHRTRTAFESDRARDAALVVAGYAVVRITYRRLLAEPARIADELRRLLVRGRN